MENKFLKLKQELELELGGDWDIFDENNEIILENGSFSVCEYVNHRNEIKYRTWFKDEIDYGETLFTVSDTESDSASESVRKAFNFIKQRSVRLRKLIALNEGLMYKI